MMWWAVWCAAVVAAGAGAAAAPAPDALGPLTPLNLLQIDGSAPDDDSLGYAVSAAGGRFGSSAGAPWLYYLAEPHDTQGGERVKRRMPSLSIDMPMSVLRQKMSQAQERKVMALRAAANRNYLDGIGKRGFQWTPMLDSERYF